MESLLGKHTKTIVVILGNLDEALKDMIGRDGIGQYYCTQCDFVSKHKSSITRHIESKHLNTAGVQCDICDQVCSTRNALTPSLYTSQDIINNVKCNLF